MSICVAPLSDDIMESGYPGQGLDVHFTCKTHPGINPSLATQNAGDSILTITWYYFGKYFII